MTILFARLCVAYRSWVDVVDTGRPWQESSLYAGGVDVLWGHQQSRPLALQQGQQGALASQQSRPHHPSLTHQHRICGHAYKIKYKELLFVFGFQMHNNLSLHHITKISSANTHIVE